jgi:hypothetical protein
MMLDTVPALSSEESGTGTVVIAFPERFCVTTWLPRRRTSKNPSASKILHTSRPDRTRSLPNQHLNLRHEHFAVQPACDFSGIS